MSTAVEIQRAIEQLSAEEADKLRDWFLRRDADQWDAEMEQDLKAGKLDSLMSQALDDLKNGRTSPL